MSKTTFVIVLLSLLPLVGCDERSAEALPLRRDVAAEAEAARRLAEMERQAEEAEQRQLARRAAREAEYRRLEEEAQRKDQAIIRLVGAMYTYGAPKLPGIERSPRRQEAYKRHLGRVASMIMESIAENAEPLLSRDEDPYLIAAIAYHEASWADEVISGRRRGSRGEVGIMQIMPRGFCSFSTPDGSGRRLDIHAPVDNLRLGAECLRKIRARHGYTSIWETLTTYASGQRWPVGREAVEGETGFRGIFEALRSNPSL